MYVIVMKDKYGGIYLCEQIEYYLDKKTADARLKDLRENNRDSRYQLIRVDLDAARYPEYLKKSNDIIYEGDLYTDIDKCMISGEYKNYV